MQNWSQFLKDYEYSQKFIKLTKQNKQTPTTTGIKITNY